MSNSTKASILIIEDDPEQVRLYAKILRGYRLTCVATGTAALEAVAQAVPNLILLDHVLAEGERGTDFLPQLKAVAAHVPIIMISGTLEIREQLAALQGPLAAHYVIEKPVQVEQLERAVEQALERCGIGETVAVLKSLEGAEKECASDPDRRFTERLERQHALRNALRGSDPAALSISALARQHRVDRKTIRRDLRDLVGRGDLDPALLREEAEG